MRTRPVPLGRGEVLDPGGPTLLAGVLNVTPDSFSDGGAHASAEEALSAARALVAAGADWIDVGGESSRPGARPVPADEEIARVVPVIRALAENLDVPVSIDTRKADVFRAAHAAGARILNDVSGLRFDPDLAPAAAATDVAVVLMHMRGTPETMEARACYADVTAEVLSELAERIEAAEAAGIARERLILDPGIGFAKGAEDNWVLLRELGRLAALECPLLVGASRKRFLGTLTGHADPRRRDAATAALAGHLALAGVEIVRVHAPGAARDAIRVAEALHPDRAAMGASS